MRRILFLDDSPERHQFMKEVLARYADVTYVWTAQQCIDQLRDHGETFDLVMLDHDLGEQGVFESYLGQNTGSEVTRFIANSLDSIHYPKNIMIHSWNEVGVKYMTETIQPTGIPVSAKRFKV